MNRPDVDESSGREAVDASPEHDAEMPPSNWFIDALERVLPNLPTLGVLVLVLAAFLIASGSNRGATEEVLGGVNDAAAAAAAPGNDVAF